MINKQSVFPPNPTNGLIFELKPGLFVVYDAFINSWLKIASNTIILPIATSSKDGAMSSSDYKKLNKLVLTPPRSSIIGNNCTAPFRNGNIGLSSGDKFITVEGTVNVGNIDQYGDGISKQIEFKIHPDTNGFNFDLNMATLVSELKRRNQLNFTGRTGEVGIVGDDGKSGIDYVLAGPPGTAGDRGSSPGCDITVEKDSLAIRSTSDSLKGIVKVNVVKDPIDQLKYSLVIDRQTIGSSIFAADKFNVKLDKSSWLLAISSSGVNAVQTQRSHSFSGNADRCDFRQVVANQPMPIYYIDIEPLIEVIHVEFLREVNILKSGYEKIVKYWIDVMSALFDKQKNAICAALEHCLSRKENTRMRDHIENVAASAAGSANVVVYGRNLTSGAIITPQLKVNDNVIANQKVEVDVIVIDPTVHISSFAGCKVNLGGGNYIMTIIDTNIRVDGYYRSNLKIQHLIDGNKKNIEILNRGSFASISDSKSAYENLSLSFRHDGGLVVIWIPSSDYKKASGKAEITLSISESPPPQDSIVKSSVYKIPDYYVNWTINNYKTNDSDSIVISISSQEYLICRRLKNNLVFDNNSSIPDFFNWTNLPALALPVLNNKVIFPASVDFSINKDLYDVVIDKIERGDFINIGNKDSKWLKESFNSILFPVNR